MCVCVCDECVHLCVCVCVCVCMCVSWLRFATIFLNLRIYSPKDEREYEQKVTGPIQGAIQMHIPQECTFVFCLKDSPEAKTVCHHHSQFGTCEGLYRRP